MSTRRLTTTLTPGRTLAAAIFLLQTAGCSGWLRGDVGFATSTTMNAGRQGVALDADAAFGPDDSPILADIGLHGKAAPKTGDAAGSVGLIHIGLFGPVGWYALGSVSVLDIGASDRRLSFGLFGPAAEVGLVIRPSLVVVRPLMFTVGTRFEYDLHFTSQPHEGFWSLNVGAALGRAK